MATLTIFISQRMFKFHWCNTLWIVFILFQIRNNREPLDMVWGIAMTVKEQWRMDGINNYIFFIDPMPPLDSENLYSCLLTSQTRFQGQKYRKMGGSWAACSICCKKSLKLAANCCNWQMEASINSIISWCIHRVLIHSPFNFQQFEATGSLCSNLPKFAATPQITKICYFEAKWQLAIGKNRKSSRGIPTYISSFLTLKW